ncbi:MAG TPA: hypothetical protein VGG33_16165 [Polyangia bacterium]
MMTRPTLTRALSVLGLCLSIAGCGGSDKTVPPIDAPVEARGTGGRAGSGGAGGSGGRVDAAPETGMLIDTNTPDTGGDAADGGGDSGRTDTAGDGGAADASETGGTPDAPVNMDTAPDTMTPVEAAPLTITNCNQINCPSLTSLVTTCNGSGSACTTSMSTAGQVSTLNYCHANGVEKVATYNDATKFTSMRVQRANGTHCYTLEMSPSGMNQENWTYKSPTGTILGTAVSNFSATGSTITLRCNGGTYVIDTAQVDCAGTDGQPGPTECTAGACTP